MHPPQTVLIVAPVDQLPSTSFHRRRHRSYGLRRAQRIPKLGNDHIERQSARRISCSSWIETRGLMTKLRWLAEADFGHSPVRRRSPPRIPRSILENIQSRGEAGHLFARLRVNGYDVPPRL